MSVFFFHFTKVFQTATRTLSTLKKDVHKADVLATRKSKLESFYEIQTFLDCFSR